MAKISGYGVDHQVCVSLRKASRKINWTLISWKDHGCHRGNYGDSAY